MKNWYVASDKEPSSKLPKWKYSYFPTLEITTSIPRNGCVVDCVFCPQRTLQKTYQGERFLSLDNFKRIIDKIPQEIRITFAGFTEPWLNKHCTDMVLYAHEKGHSIAVFTTGIGMRIEDFERIRHIQFAPKPNGGFVLHIPDQERRAKHPITPKYVELLNHIQVTHFNGQPIHNYHWMCMGTPHECIRDVISTADVPDMWSRAGNLLGEAILKPELLNLKDHFRSIYHGEQDMTCSCDERLYHNVMLPNGDVSLCCMDYGLEHILGNLLEQEYEDILPEPYSCFKLCRFCENGVSPNSEMILKEKENYNL
jgi:organic radical activating enzyme